MYRRTNLSEHDLGDPPLRGPQPPHRRHHTRSSACHAVTNVIYPLFPVADPAATHIPAVPTLPEQRCCPQIMPGSPTGSGAITLDPGCNHPCFRQQPLEASVLSASSFPQQRPPALPGQGACSAAKTNTIICFFSIKSVIQNQKFFLLNRPVFIATEVLHSQQWCGA